MCSKAGGLLSLDTGQFWEERVVSPKPSSPQMPEPQEYRKNESIINMPFFKIFTQRDNEHVLGASWVSGLGSSGASSVLGPVLDAFMLLY